MYKHCIVIDGERVLPRQQRKMYEIERLVKVSEKCRELFYILAYLEVKYGFAEITALKYIRWLEKQGRIKVKVTL